MTLVGRLVERVGVWRQHRQRLGHLGEGTIIAPSAQFYFHERLTIGRWCRIGSRCELNAEGGIAIGDGTIFAPQVAVLSSTHHYDQENYLPYDATDDFRPVSIGRGVWLGHGAMVAPGAQIGDAVVVGMGALASGNVASGSVVVGNPGRIIATRDPDAVASLLSSRRFFLRAVCEEGLARPKQS